MFKKLFLYLGLLGALVFFQAEVYAQETTPEGPVYIVQEGDTLFTIAFRFAVTVDELVEANDIGDPNQLSVGDRLVIPGLVGVRGILTTSTIPYGESLTSLSRKYRIPSGDLARLNRVVSPAELAVGSQMILPVGIDESQSGGRQLLQEGQSMLELAVLEGSNPWGMSTLNHLSGPTSALAQDVFLLPNEQPAGPGALPPPISLVGFSNLPLVQGETTTIAIDAGEDLQITGELQTQDLRNGDATVQQAPFFPYEYGGYVAMLGVHAMAKPGLYPFRLEISDSEGRTFAFSQFISVSGGGYGFDPPLTVPPETVDRDVTQPEDEIWNGLGRQMTPSRLWKGRFQSPSPFGDCWTSLYGSRRSYNGSAYNFFHTGLDFCGGVGIEVRAPAPGVVTFAEPLVVRGNAVMIDHGWGVHTGYMHLAEILVEEGERVETGQLIGIVGGTGRVTGAHLHWEVWVGGVQVNPTTWLEEEFPKLPDGFKVGE